MSDAAAIKLRRAAVEMQRAEPSAPGPQEVVPMARTRRARVTLARVVFAVTAACAAAAAPAHAGLLDALSGCPSTPPATAAFARFLDPLPYVPLPDGGFESGADGWSLGGASVVTG